jgi:hypothetical protein
LPISLVAAFVVKDDDLGFEDDVLGAYEIELDDAEFIMRPRETIPLTLQLLEADDSGFINDMKAMSRAVRRERLCSTFCSQIATSAACTPLLWGWHDNGWACALHNFNVINICALHDTRMFCAALALQCGCAQNRAVLTGA